MDLEVDVVEEASEEGEEEEEGGDSEVGTFLYSLWNFESSLLINAFIGLFLISFFVFLS